MSNKKSLPGFLKGTTVNDEQKKNYERVLGNWLRVHKFISEFNASVIALHMLKQLMIVEYSRKDGPRMDIIVRLHGKFQSLRYKHERVEIGRGY